MSFLLKITAGKDAGNEFTLHDGKNMIGRSRSSDVRVFNEDVSGKHFSIDVENGIATLQNISGYGTRVDGILVHQSLELRSGQVIEAGKTLKFLFEVTGAENANTADNNDGELTEATRYVGDLTDTAPGAGTDFSEETQATRFADDAAQENMNSITGEIELTSITKFNDDESGTEVRELSEETSVTRFSDTLYASVEKDSGSASGAEKTSAGNDRTEVSETAAFETKNLTGITQLDETRPDNATELKNGKEAFFSAPPQETGTFNTGSISKDTLEEQGMFFEDEELDDSEKTNANETQVVQTRMASMDEINFIKNQIKKQQQNRLFLKFLIFSLFVVLLGMIWMLRAPGQEKNLSWPADKNGVLVANKPVFGQGMEKGGFNIYYPDLPNAEMVQVNKDTVEIRSFLGAKRDVPLLLMIQREVSDEFVYENRLTALQNALRRLSEKKDEQFNFESSPTSYFCHPDGQNENGLLIHRLTYQRENEKGNSYFGILRFFRNKGTNYIIRAEVPAEEKMRAMAALVTENFFLMSYGMQQKHWEGSDEYTKGDIARNIVGIKDELQRNSPMQYPRLERAIKSILAQALYEKNQSVYKEAESLLRLLRVRQQHWYNGQKIRWISADKEGNAFEKRKIRNDCEAVFSISGDRRRYDILRDKWE